MADFSLLVLLLGGSVFAANCENVLFPYGIKFQNVDQFTIEAPDPGIYDMIVDTGSQLYDAWATEDTPTKKLAMNIPVKSFVSPSGRYFRAHPVFLKCAEQAIMKLSQDNIQVVIVRGYITMDETGGSDMDVYHLSGSAIELAIFPGSSGTVEDIAGAVLKACPVILERELRDLGLIIMENTVHFHMTEADALGPPIYADRRATGITDLESWAQTKINEGLEPKASSDCEQFSILYSGDSHPIGKSQDTVVGTLDTPITRRMIKDFSRLVQYQGTDIEFEHSEVNAGWCDEPGTPCPVHCTSRIQGNSIANRCADRVMSTRLRDVLSKVSKRVRVDLQDKLKVTEAWDEAYEGKVDGDTENMDTLHYEGRAAKLKLVSGDETKLGDLAKYAACFGGDYVQHRGSYIYVIVKRMKAGGGRTVFPNIALLSVEPPEASESLYNLSSTFSEKEKEDYPLFDKGGRLDTKLATNLTIGQFASKDYRYFRLKPKLVECLRDVIYVENQRKAADVPEVEIEVVTGYLTNRENKNRFDPLNDGRHNSHNLGRALQLRYTSPNNSIVYTPYRLLFKVIDKCAYRFHLDKKSMGLGLYPNSIFVDMRPRFTLMRESLNNLPDGVDRDTFEDVVRNRVQLAKDRRVVDPDNYATACLFHTAPQLQSYAFVHEHSEAVKRRRRKRQTTDDEECVATRETNFCFITKVHRIAVVDEIMSMLDRKHFPGRSRSEIKAVLEGCFSDCGTCLEGPIYEDKTEHCNNFLHWVDWTLSNTGPHMTNFYVSMAQHACEDGNDCVDNSPLFSLIAPSYWKIFREDPNKSPEEFVYPSAKNPNPAMALLTDIYAIQASGIVKFWVRDDNEMTVLKRPLEVVMLYNKNVEHVEIYIERYKLTKDAVRGIIEKAARKMTKQGCPEVTREAIASYSLHEVPPERRRRAVEEPSKRFIKRQERLNIDRKWMSKLQYF